MAIPRIRPSTRVVLAALMLSAVGVAVIVFGQGSPPAEEQAQNPTTTPRITSADLVQVIERDGIAALLAPETVGIDTADNQMQDDEPVLGVSLNGEHRAYSLPFLTQHEIANDVLGGQPIAVTW
jgi:hypothetical protein